MLEPHSECPLTPCIRLLAGAWTLEILYYLRLSPMRFGDLRRALGSVSSKVLTTRLRELEAKKVISRTELPTNPVSVEYKLAEIGRELLPIIETLSSVSETIREKYQA